jgi:hypothetical protein
MDNKVRVRFAPSPTGYLHVGGPEVLFLIISLHVGLTGHSF